MLGETEPLARGRARLEDRANGLQVVIPARRQVGLILFMAAWLTGWFFGERSALHVLLHPRGGVADLFMVLWLLGWTVGGFFAVLVLLWTLVGREVITTDDRILSVRRELLGLGRVRRYDLANVKDLRCAPMPENPRSRESPWAGGVIAFDYGPRTIRFGTGIDEAEAKMLVTRLVQRNPWRR
jgi:hypothetical protein